MPERCGLEAGGSHRVLTPLGETSREYGGTPLRAWGPRWDHSRAGGLFCKAHQHLQIRMQAASFPALVGKLL